VGSSHEETGTVGIGPSRDATAPSEGLELPLERVPIQQRAWADFVAKQQNAVLFHHPEWARLLADCYGYEAFALTASDRSGQIVAGLPVMEISGLLRRRRWVALPFTDTCSALVNGDLEAAFASDLARFRAASGASALEVRTGLTTGQAFRAEIGTIHTLDLTPGLDAVYKTFSRSRVRPEIKRAEREGVRIREATQSSDLTSTFYDLHVATRRRQGVPVQPRRFFDLLWHRLLARGLGFALVADLADRAVAGAVFLAWNGTVIYKYAASDEAYRWARPNHLLLWEAIRRSFENDVHTIDFGRSDADNEGLRKFKSGWGAKEELLAYSTFADDAPAQRARSSPRLQRLLRETIRRSPPWVCRGIGTAAYRYVA
jgi:CelD/BcsL family acetyltransferase involved in cellulose biosynthesis